MRKRITPRTEGPAPEAGWLDLEAIASAELSSEAPGHPLEAALAAGGGWRAAEPGEQTIRLTFDAPREISRVYLVFVEPARERTQELALLWSEDGRSFRELLRQQWSFNPETAPREVEDYRVSLKGVLAIELRIRPDIRGGDATASLAELRLA